MAIAPEKKCLSDTGGVKEYEIQTSSRKDSVLENISKKGRWNIPVVWISNNKTMLTDINKITEKRDEVILV